MKKALLIILPFILTAIIIFIILFTPFGSNAVVKPIVNSALKSKIKEPQVEITKLDSNFGFINVEAAADNGLKAKAKGDINYFKQDFNLNYTLLANSLKVKEKRLPVKMNINGQASGKPNNLSVNGKGKAFNSDINYNFIVKNRKPQMIEAKIDRANIEQMLLLGGIEPYIDGFADVNINMPSLNIHNPKGKGEIIVRDGQFNRHLIAKKFNIVLPRDEKFKAHIKTKVIKNRIIGAGVIKSTSAKLKVSKLISLLDFSVLKGNFDLNIPKLSRLNQIAKQRLRGSANVNGQFYLNSKKNIKQVNVYSSSFGGKATVKYSGDSVDILLNRVSIPKIFWTLSMPKYLISGDVNGKINVPNLKTLEGNFNLGSSGRLNPKILKIKLPKYNYKMHINGKLANGTVYAKKAWLKSGFATIYLSKTEFSLLTQALTANFTADIKNIAILNKITGQNLRGPFKMSGHIDKMKNRINFNGNSKSLGGNLNIKYSGKSLKAKFNKVSLPKLLYMVSQRAFLKSGFVNGVVNVNSISPLNGAFAIASKGWVDNLLVKTVYNINLGSNFKYALNIKDGVIRKGVIYAKPNLNTTMGSLVFSEFVFNSNSSSMKGKYSLKIEDLNKLYPITKRELKGKFYTKGNISLTNGNLIVSGNADELGGTINYILHNNNLTIDIAGVSVVQATRMLVMDDFLDGIAKAQVIYNTKSKSGRFNIDLNDARFLNSQLVVLLKQFAHFDLSKEIFSNANINGTINDNIIVFNVKTHSNRTKININDGKIDTKAQTINAKVHFNYNNNDYQFKVTGDLKHPHLKLVFGGYIKEKIKQKVLEKVFGKAKMDKNGTVGDAKNKIKEVKEKAKEKAEDKVKKEIKKVVPKEVKGLFKLFK